MCLCNGYRNVVYKWATKIPQLWNHRRVNQWPQSAVIATASLLTAPHEQWLNSLANKWAVFKAWLANKWLGIFINWRNEGPNKGTLSYLYLFGCFSCVSLRNEAQMVAGPGGFFWPLLQISWQDARCCQGKCRGSAVATAIHSLEKGVALCSDRIQYQQNC